jgi:hypothetical protein
MRHEGAAFLLGLALAATGCGGKRVEINSETEPVGTHWNATLATPQQLAGAVQVKGTGWMGGEKGDTAKTRAFVSIQNAVPGGEHPWHVHIGQCGSDRGIFGAADAYEPLRVGSSGVAQETTVLRVPAPTTGQYFINVHASRNNMETIIACGNLAPPSR